MKLASYNKHHVAKCKPRCSVEMETPDTVRINHNE